MFIMPIKQQINKALAVLACVILTCVASEHGHAQTPVFSQPFSNPLYYNPAYTGLERGVRARMHFRHQYDGLTDSYDNIAFSIDFPERNMPGAGGFGILVMSDLDGIGLVNTTTLRATYSARVQLSNSIVTQFGIGPSFSTRRVDWDRLVFSDQIDAYGIHTDVSAFGPPEHASLQYPDLGFGMILQYFGESGYFPNIITTIGLSVDHTFQPDISFSGTPFEMPIKYVLTGNMLFDRNPLRTYTPCCFRDHTSLRLKPGFVFEMHDRLQAFSAGIDGYRNNIYLGLWGRAQQIDDVSITDIIIKAGLDVPISETSSIRLIYSYDYMIGNHVRTVGTTHELSAIFRLNNFSLFGQQADRFGRNRRLRPLDYASF